MRILRVGILVLDEVEVLDACGPFEVFGVTGRISAGIVLGPASRWSARRT